MVQQRYWLLAAWDKRLSSGQPCQLTVCCSTVFSVSRYLWLMPAALIIEQQIPLQFVALGASNSHFNYSPGQSMTELGRGERIQWGCLIKKKKNRQNHPTRLLKTWIWAHWLGVNRFDWLAATGMTMDGKKVWSCWGGKRRAGIQNRCFAQSSKIESFSDVSGDDWSLRSKVHQRLARHIKFIRGMATRRSFMGKWKWGCCFRSTLDVLFRLLTNIFLPDIKNHWTLEGSQGCWGSTCRRSHKFSCEKWEDTNRKYDYCQTFEMYHCLLLL